MSDFTYIIKNSKRARNISLKINSKGEIILSKPYLIPKFIAIQFLNSQKTWIQKKLATINLNQNQNIIYYLGQKYQIQFSVAKFSCTFKDKSLYLTGPSEKLAKSELIKNLKNQSRQAIKKSVQTNSVKMQLNYNQIRLKDQSSRWGSCSSQKNLNFNWRLIMSPSPVLNYVVIHELAHLKHLDHSRNFWGLVEKYDPDYRDHRRWLKQNGHLLQSF